MRRLVDTVERRTSVSRGTLACLLAAAVFLGGAAMVLRHLTGQVEAGSGRFVNSDPRHLRWFTMLGGGLLGDASRHITPLGAISVLVQVAAVVAVGLWWRRARAVVALAPLLAVLTAGVATYYMKVEIARRPPGARAHVSAGTSFTSFPSGHAADSSALYVALALVAAIVLFRRPLTRLVAVAVGFGFPGAIGLSRLVLGVHWPTDVLAGWALGSAVAIVVVMAALLVSGGGIREPAVVEPREGAGDRSSDPARC